MKAYPYIRNNIVYLRLRNEVRQCGTIKTTKDHKFFVTERNKAHYCVKHNAWGITKAVIDLLLDNNIDTIIVNYHHTDKSVTKYSTTITNIALNGTEDLLNKDFDTQVFMPLNKWKEMKA